MPTEANLVLPLDAFIRSISVGKGTSYGFFLGAGASISSNVRSASGCIWDWKYEIFSTNNVDVAEQLAEVSLPSVQRRIQQWFDSVGGYPALWSDDEYGFYVERCYPIPSDRRQYFQNLAAAAKPHGGYHLLCLLAKAELVPYVWTTNFDGLVGRAAASIGIPAIEVGLDSTGRVDRQPNRRELMVVALHGDYRYDALKNTPKELQEQNQQLSSQLVNRLRDTTLIVSGYSGRDGSVMAALNRAYSQSGVGRLYWCGVGDQEPPPAVRELLLTARRHRRLAYYVPTAGFDDLLIRLGLRCLQGDLKEQAQTLHTSLGAVQHAQPTPFQIHATETTGFIRSNAYAVTCPSEVYQFEAASLQAPGLWQNLRNITAGTEVVAVPQKGKILALGTADGIRKLFRSQMNSAVERVPISERDFDMPDGVVVSLLLQAVARSLSETHGLETDDRGALWRARAASKERIDGTLYTIYDAVRLALRQYGDQQYLVLMPTVIARDEQGSYRLNNSRGSRQRPMTRRD